MGEDAARIPERLKTDSIPDSLKTDGVDDSGVGASPVDLLSVNLTGGMELEFVRPRMVQTGHCIRLWSLNFPEMAMRHAGELMWNHRIADDHLAILDSSFCVKSGLASSGSEWLSLEAENYPGFYVRHRGFRLEISRYDGSSLFRSDATWRMVAPWMRTAQDMFHWYPSTTLTVSFDTVDSNCGWSRSPMGMGSSTWMLLGNQHGPQTTLPAGI